MPGHQGVEEVPQGGQGLVLGRAVAGELVNQAAGEAGRNPGQLKVLILAPGEKAAHHTGIGRGGCGDWRCERRRTHRRQTAPWRRRAQGRPGPIGMESQGPGSRQKSGLCRGAVHGDLDNEPFAKFASRWDLLPGRVVIPGSAGVPPAQDLAGSWRLASQGWSVHLPTGAGAAPLQECGRDARAPRGNP